MEMDLASFSGLAVPSFFGGAVSLCSCPSLSHSEWLSSDERTNKLCHRDRDGQRETTFIPEGSVFVFPVF